MSLSLDMALSLWLWSWQNLEQVKCSALMKMSWLRSLNMIHMTGEWDLFYTSKAWSHGKFQRSDYSENAQNSSSLQNGDVSFIKFLIDVFYNDYSKRIRQAPFVDAPLVFLPGWNIVKSWLTGTHSPNLIRLKYFTAFWWIIQVWFSRDLTYTTIQSIFSKVADWSAMTSSLFWLKTICFDFMKTENQLALFFPHQHIEVAD